jgi:O-antigen/teichoic acid export membrane protein
MSLKRNILANYASQTYVTLIGILMLPVYLRYMGAEACGLVGFFTMLNALFQLLVRCPRFFWTRICGKTVSRERSLEC